ncbi:MAG: hypothetical protein JNJ88_03390 [Planctomycetes bacterium]|nr:hypothetical protein [Planctomycetota bacterium]
MGHEETQTLPPLPLRLRIGLWIAPEARAEAMPAVARGIRNFFADRASLAALFLKHASKSDPVQQALHRWMYWILGVTSREELVRSAMERAQVAITWICNLDAPTLPLLEQLIPDANAARSRGESFECHQPLDPAAASAFLNPHQSSLATLFRNLAVRCTGGGNITRSKLSTDHEELAQVATKPASTADGSPRSIGRRCDLLILVGTKEQIDAAVGPGASHLEGASLLDAEIPRERFTEGDVTIRLREGAGLSPDLLAHHASLNVLPTSASERERWKVNCEREREKLGLAGGPPKDGEQAQRAFASVVERMVPYYAAFDLAAQRFQKQREYAVSAVAILAPLAVFVVACSLFLPAWVAPICFSIEMIMLLTIGWFVLRAILGEVHKRWIELRLLAEWMRTMMAVLLAGHRPTHIAPLRYLAPARDLSRLARIVGFEFDLACERRLAGGVDGHTAAVPPQAIATFINRVWLNDQRRYHRKTSKNMRRYARRIRLGTGLIFVMAIAVCGVHLSMLIAEIGTKGSGTGHSPIEHALMTLSLTIPAVGAGLGSYRGHREFDRLASRSEGMAAALREVQREILAARTPEALQIAVRRAEELTLREVQGWVSLMNFAEPEAEA